MTPQERNAINIIFKAIVQKANNQLSLMTVTARGRRGGTRRAEAGMTVEFLLVLPVIVATDCRSHNRR